MASVPQLSIVIPAHNEEDYLPLCLSRISKCMDQSGLSVEVVVVLNRCTDSTEQIAREFGAAIVYEDAKNIAKIRNAGIRASLGASIVTIDADSYMTEGTLTEIASFLSDENVVAGGADFQPERRSIPILLSYGISKLMAKRAGGSMALYWFRRSAFDAIGGFDEKRPLGEDIDFSSRLRVHVERIGSRYEMLRENHVITSCRKFDQFGDWYAIKLALFESNRVRTMMEGSNTQDMDTFYYETRQSGDHRKQK